MDEKDDISSLIHFNGSTILTVEDPKFLYFIRHLIWNKFARQIGYFGLNFASQYDFALSFSGEDRDYAEKLFELLHEQEIYVFYDRNEQDRIIGNDVEEYLAPIYRSQARFVLALLSNTYSKKIWTKFESENFRERFGEGSIIPVWFSDVSPGMFDDTQKIGGLTIDRSLPIEEACDEVIQILRKKIAEDRQLEISFEKKIAQEAIES